MDPKISTDIERKIPDLLAKMRQGMKEFPLRRDFVLENGPGRYEMETTYFEYYYADFPELDGMVRILENHGLVRDTTSGNKKRFVIGEELADYLLRDSMTPHPSAGLDATGTRRRGFAPNADDHRMVCAVVSNIGGDWTTHLREVCLQLHRVNALLPKVLSRAEGVDSWEELADSLDTGSSSTRERIVKYINYRIAWTRRNPPRG